MSLSGYQEASSDSLAGVPIKKRKIPLVALSSASSQLSSSVSRESGPSNKEHSVSESESSLSGPTQDLSPLVTRADHQGDEKDKLAYRNNEVKPKTEESIGSIVQPVRVKVENSSTVVDALEDKVEGAMQLKLSTRKWPTGEGIGTEDNSILSENSSCKSVPLNNEKYPSTMVPSNIQMLLTLRESSERQFECPKNGAKPVPDEKFEGSKVLANTGLQLKIEESSGPHIEGIYQEQNNCPLNLGLCQTEINVPISSKKGSKIQCKIVDFKSQVCDGSDSSNRSHWDLNTMMDTWDGPGCDPRTKIQMERSIYFKSNDSYKQKKPPVFVRKQGDGGGTGTSVTLGKHAGETDATLTLSCSSAMPCKYIGKSDQSLNLSYPSKMPHEHLDQGMNLQLQLNPMCTLGSHIKGESSSQAAKLHSLTGCGEGSELTLSIKATPPPTSNMKLAECGTIKPEPVEEANGGMLKTVDDSWKIVPSQSTVKLEPSIAEESIVKSVVYQNVKPEPVEENRMKHVNVGLSGHLEKQYTHENISDKRSPCKQSEASIGISGLVPESIGSSRNEPLISSTQKSCVGGVNASLCGSTTATKQCSDMYSDGGVARNDNEDKTNKYVEEATNGNDDKSNGINNSVGPTDLAAKPHDADDEYEDGEVREAIHASCENTGCGLITSDVRDCPDGQCSTSADNENATSAPSGVQNIKTGITDGKDINFTPVGGQDDKTAVFSKVFITNSDKIENSSKLSATNSENMMDHEKMNTLDIKTSRLRETLASEVLKSVSTKKKPTRLLRKIPQSSSSKEGPKSAGIISDQAVAATKGLAAECNAKVSKTGEPSKAESSLNCEEADKDANCKVNRCRIINLPRNSSSPNVETKPASGRPLSSRTEGDRYSEKSSKLHSRGSRDESFKKGPQKFQRVRDQDQPNVISGSDPSCARGRFDTTLDTFREEWILNRDYPAEHYNATSASRFSGPRSAVMLAPSEHEPDYVVGRDGAIFNAGRAGRRLANNELLDLPFRRRSPSGRDLGPVPLGLRMCQGSLREVSPDRFLGDGSGTDMPMLRHEENFMRGLSAEMMDSLGCSQSHYEQDDPYVRRERSFSPIQRRGTLRIQHMPSKSPPRPRNRSPDSWSSPRKRSSDGMGRPPVFKAERMRSPHQRLGFSEDMTVSRRRGSPSFIPRLATDMRDIGSARHYEAGISFIPNRNPADRVLRRSNSRYDDMVDPRGRTEDDEYLEPMRTGRFHEFAGNECLDNDGHKIGERYRRGHSFRSFNGGSDVEGFHCVEDGAMPYRFCPEPDTEFHERVSPRGFEGRIKRRLGNHPRRLRSMEEEENNLRYSEQRWQESSFSDERLRRRRF